MRASPELTPGAAAPLIAAAGYRLYRITDSGPICVSDLQPHELCEAFIRAAEEVGETEFGQQQTREAGRGAVRNYDDAYPGQAGNGLHVHISLLDKQGNNIFATDNPLESETLRHAIGGIQQTMAASMAFLCPNVNSYRRLWDQGFWAPVYADWGYQNRTCGLRVSAAAA